jgi:hypothetical protein
VSTSASVRVTGVPATLRALKRVDPAARKRVPDRLKAAAGPILADARATIPATPPTSGWSTGGRLGFDPSKVRRSIRLRVRATRGRRRTPGEYTVLAITSGPSPAAAIWDMAGRRSAGATPSGRAFVRALKRRRRASRSLWPAVERNARRVEREIERVLDEIERETARAIRSAR